MCTGLYKVVGMIEFYLAQHNYIDCNNYNVTNQRIKIVIVPLFCN